MNSASSTNERISPGTRIGKVSLRVRDLEKAENFYERVLGLEIMETDGQGVDLGIAPDRVLVSLIEDPDAPVRSTKSTGLYHFAILVPDRSDLAVVLQRLLSRSYPLQGAADHYVSEAVYLADPEGNGIEVYADRPEAEWYTRDGEMRMGTVPLDVDDLLSTLDGNKERAERLPGATRVGHIHLHVSDLEAAISFYRELLGFELMMLYGPSAGFLSAGGYHHHIGVNTWAGEGAPPPAEGSAGLIDYSILVPDKSDLERITERAEKSQYNLQADERSLTISDPSSNRIVIRHEQR